VTLTVVPEFHYLAIALVISLTLVLLLTHIPASRVKNQTGLPSH
jgi:hypothetical protein